MANQIDLIQQAKEQEMARHKNSMALLDDIEQSATDERNQSLGIHEEYWELKQLANHNDHDCRSFADTHGL